MAITEKRRVIVGVCVLLTVNVIWVLSSELTNYIFITEGYNKPFFTTYLKSSLFSLLLFGFLCRTHWRMLTCPQRYYSSVCINIQNSENIDDHDDVLSDPTYVRINQDSSDEEGLHNPDDDYVMVNRREDRVGEDRKNNIRRNVTFNKLKEVRHLSDTYAEDSLVARMSYKASKSLEREMLYNKIIEQGFLPATHVMKLALQFCFCWFVASYAYQKSLSTTLPAVVNVVSSTSSLFTLILASIFPSSEKDKFSLTKLFVVFLSIAGVALISFAEYFDSSKFQYEGIIWGLIGALGYAVYLVNLRRSVKDENQISLPMFLGFVGLWTIITLWPGFIILNWTFYETFQLPTGIQIGSVLLNGVLGTVGAELMWLWGCFLTSSLTATLAMCLTIPLTMLTDYIIKKKVYNWIFYFGSVPIIASFIAIAYLTNGPGPSPDPLGNCLRRVFCVGCEHNQYEVLSSTDPDNNNNSDNDVSINSGEGPVAGTTRGFVWPCWGIFSSKVATVGSRISDRDKLLINDLSDNYQQHD